MDRWDELVRARLFDRRTVFVTGELDDVAAAHAAAELMTLDGTGDDAVQLQLDSPGGTLEAALTLMDVIDLLGVPVRATCVGRVAGAAAGVLAVADRRIAMPHARLRLCEPRVSFEGRAADIASWADHHHRQLGNFCERLAGAMRRPIEKVADDLRAGRWLDADEALRIGLVDEIARPGEVREFPVRGFGFRP